MGANAQTTVQKFVDGAVLTAAQQNTSAATGVPVFATTVTRDAAFGGANKVLAEGQTCYLESTNVVQYYDGAAWATVGPAAAGALVRVGGGALSSTSTTFAGVFSATYENYLIVCSNLAIVAIRMTFGSAASNYNWAYNRVSFGGVASQAAASGTTDGILMSDSNPSLITGFQIFVCNPFLSVATSATLQIPNSGSATPYMMAGGGYHSTAASYTAFTFASPDSMSGTVNIYGYALS